MYPLVTKEQRQKHREIWGEMIESKKRNNKRELRNLQSFVRYRDIKASSRCRSDKANRGTYWPCGCCLGSFVGNLLVVYLFQGFVLGLFAGFLFGFFWVSCGSLVYTSCARRGALRFLFNKIYLSKKKKKN